jgi:hypothetical protein
MTLSAPNEVRAILAQLVGLRCEGLDNPHGSVLSLDIGPLGHRPDDAPSARPHGWRHLTILSPWRLRTATEVIADWNIPGGAKGRLLESVKRLVGQAVTRAQAEPPGWDLLLTFGDGSVLQVFADSNANRDDAWFILGTDGLELGVGPAKAGATGNELRRPR